MSRILQLRRQHPLWTWRECWRVARSELPPIPWDQIGWGAVVVLLCLLVLSQAVRRWEAGNWLCTRAGYAPVNIKGQWVAGAPCLEETNIRTGEVRDTPFAKARNGY